MKKLKFQLLGAIVLSLNSVNSCAGILAESTRVIYPENKREVAVMLNNTNQYPIITQVWVDQGLGDPDKAQAPFMVLAPIFKLQPNESKGIRILMTPQHSFPHDRESLFWLNLYEVPSVQAQHLAKDHLNMSMNTQLKLIYRPENIAVPDIQKVSQQLQISLHQQDDEYQIHIQNPSAHYVSIAQIFLESEQQQVAPQQADLVIAPKSQQSYVFTMPLHPTNKLTLNLTLIDDQGHHHSFQRAL